jgi:hypothetical protein
MVEIERDARFARSSEFTKRRLLRIGIASALAGGMLVGVSAADARTTHIQVLTRATAFGGYSFPGVGQYEAITGIASGEVDPNDPKNALITDIQLAPRNANGTVSYQHNFYILKPIDLSKGNHKMMYEPPNRGGKTYQTLNRTPDGTNDPGALTEAAFPGELANSFLWTRGYTTVWSGWENNLGALSGLTATASFPVAHTVYNDPTTIIIEVEVVDVVVFALQGCEEGLQRKLLILGQFAGRRRIGKTADIGKR